MIKLKPLKRQWAFMLILFAGASLFTGCMNDVGEIPPIGMEVLDYMKQNVEPVMKPYRIEFDKKLSTEEQAQLSTMRNELKEVAMQRLKAGVELGSGKMHISELTDDQVKVVKETRNRTYKAFLVAMNIADKHEKEIRDIFSKEDVNQKKWQTDLQKIVADKMGGAQRKKKSIFRKNLQKTFPVENLTYVLFVVWNPNEPILKLN